MVPFKVDLSKEVIAITGAGGVLMSAFAKALAECGASVGIIDRNAEACAAVAAAVLEAPSLFVQVPFVAIFSTAAGIIVGVLTTFSVKYLPERLTKIK